MYRKIILGAACLVGLAILAFVGRIFYVMMPPLCSYARANEKLPAVFVETNGTVYCRMRWCDFRFPLPANARVISTKIESGGYDAINGSVYIVGTNGGPVSMRGYAEFLQKHHWEVGVVSGVGCDACTNVPDVPFVTTKEVIHYPLFDEIYAGTDKQEGGSIDVGTEANTTKIRFSFFGDL